MAPASWPSWPSQRRHRRSTSGSPPYRGGRALAAPPLAIGVAVLRYRLYDIDRIINRTPVYGLLTVLLGVIYSGIVLALGQLFGGMGEDPPSWVVAGATLAVAVLFQLARRRIQQGSTGASTGASTIRPRPSRRAAPACATRSIWTRSRPRCWGWSTRRCSRPRRRCGLGTGEAAMSGCLAPCMPSAPLHKPFTALPSTASALLSREAGRGAVVRCEAVRGIAADNLLAGVVSLSRRRTSLPRLG